jgi:hypothetical protein
MGSCPIQERDLEIQKSEMRENLLIEEREQRSWEAYDIQVAITEPHFHARRFTHM